MDAATDSKIEVKGSMKCTDEYWQSIFGTKEVKETEDDNNANQ